MLGEIILDHKMSFILIFRFIAKICHKWVKHWKKSLNMKIFEIDQSWLNVPFYGQNDFMWYNIKF